MLNIGQFEISRVIESEGPFLPVRDFIPDAEQAVIEANRDWLYPRYIEPETDKIMLNIQSYILHTPRHTILVDTCVGNDKPRPGRPMFDHLNLPYLADLAAGCPRSPKPNTFLPARSMNSGSGAIWTAPRDRCPMFITTACFR